MLRVQTLSLATASVTVLGVTSDPLGAVVAVIVWSLVTTHAGPRTELNAQLNRLSSAIITDPTALMPHAV